MALVEPFFFGNDLILVSCNSYVPIVMFARGYDLRFSGLILHFGLSKFQFVCTLECFMFEFYYFCVHFLFAK